MENQVVWESGDYSPTLHIPPGLKRVSISADDWDGATAVVEESLPFEDSFHTAQNPYEDGDLSLTANSPLILIYGGVDLRLKVEGGSPTNLKLMYASAQ